ncbi:dihydrofolate reductase family protein [Oceanobacillus sp. CFH 90083]|uniref:dihydrofolate reductase family protein n=1 Tax=Oceanobacillus sp. CFH 90083 TaxID=2592336 RepID=UPI00128E8F72|nr:dihydrofolate reductase family protein [Oceanobacillus sp. CFH 90083]
MRKVIYSMQMSHDGYIEDASGSIGFTNPDRELHEYVNALEAKADTHIYGRRLYEVMNGFWPTAEDDPDAAPEIVEYARIWNALDKVVFSRTLKSVEGRARLAESDIASEVAKLKVASGKEISVGGATLAQSFIDLDLIDEYRVIVYPTLLGGGKPMFGSLARQVDLTLVESRSFASGVVVLIYRPTNREV